MSESSQQDLFLQAMSVLFSSSVPSRDTLTAANAFIYNFSQKRECFFTCMVVLNDQSVTELAVHAFCSNILYNKIRKQLSQLLEEEVQQLQEALVLLIQSQSFLQIVSNQYCSGNNVLNDCELPQQQQQRRDMRNVARTIFRCVAALAITTPLTLQRVSAATQLASQLLSFQHPCATISALQLLSFLQEESEATYLSRKQRKPLATHLRLTYRSLCESVLPVLLRDTLCPALGENMTSFDTVSSEEIAALCRVVSELCHALAESDGRMVRDLKISENAQIASFLLQIATQDELLVSRLCRGNNKSMSRQVISEDMSQAAVQSNLALRVFCSRTLLTLSPSGVTQQDNDDIPTNEVDEMHSATQLVDLFLENVSQRTVLGGAASELCRRECLATLMTLCVTGRLHDKLCVRYVSLPATHADSDVVRQRGCVLLETLLSLCCVSHSSDMFLLTVDFWLDTLDSLLYRRPVHSMYDATQSAYSGHAGHGSDTDEAQGSQSDSDDSDDIAGHTDKLDADEGLFALLSAHDTHGDTNIYNNSFNSVNLQWLLTRLLPRLLHLALQFSLLPSSDEDTDSSEHWDSVSAWRDTRQGSDELVSLCVTACGLRHTLPLLVCLASTISVPHVLYDTEKCDTVLRHTLSVANNAWAVSVVIDSVSQLLLSMQPFQFEALLFLLGHVSGVSQRFQKSRDMLITHHVLHILATHTMSQAMTQVRHIQQSFSCVSVSSGWQSVSQEINVPQSAMFIRSALKFLLNHATSLNTPLTPPLLEITTAEALRHITVTQALCELCVSLSLSPGVATHPFVLNESTVNVNSYVSEEWSLEAVTQTNTAVSQSAETLRRLMLSQRKQLMSHVARHSQDILFHTATQLAGVATQSLSGIVSLLEYSRHNASMTRCDTFPVYATQLIESSVSSLLTAATHMVSTSDTPETLCGVATQVISECDTLVTHLLLSVSHVTQCVATQSQLSESDITHVCRTVSRLLSLLSCFLESLVQDIPMTHDDTSSDMLHTDTLVAQMLLSLCPALHFLHNRNNRIINEHFSNNSINSDKAVTVVEAVCLVTHETEKLVSYLMYSYRDTSQFLSSFGLVSTLCHVQTEAFQLQAQLSQLLSWSVTLCRNHSLVSFLSLNNDTSRSTTLLRHIATQYQQNPTNLGDTPWQWFVTQRDTMSMSNRQVCVSLCRAIHSVSLSHNNNSVSHVSRQIVGCVATLRILERHLTTLQHVLYDTSCVPAETQPDEYYQDLVSVRHMESQGTNVFSFSLFQKQLLEILKTTCVLVTSCTTMCPELQILLSTHALQVATQMLTVKQVCPGCCLMSNRDLLVLCRDPESVATLLCRVTLYHLVPHITSLNISSGTQCNSYCYSDTEVTLFRDTWRFVSTLLTCVTDTSPSNIWQEVCRDTFHMEDDGVAETLLTLALRHMLLVSSANNSDNNRSKSDNNCTTVNNSSLTAVSSSAEHALILLLCLLYAKTHSEGHSVAVNILQSAVSQACPVVSQQLEEMQSRSPSNAASFTLQHIAHAILQQVSQVATQAFPPATQRTRRVKQLLQDLLRVSQGLQQVEVLADYFFV